MRYVGLTGNPELRKKAHGNPGDWCQCSFSTNDQACEWLEKMLSHEGNTGHAANDGWQYGYSYSITPQTYQWDDGKKE